MFPDQMFDIKLNIDVYFYYPKQKLEVAAKLKRNNNLTDYVDVMTFLAFSKRDVVYLI